MGSTTGQQVEVKAKWSPVFLWPLKDNHFIKNWNDFAFTGTQLDRGHAATPLYLRWMWASPCGWCGDWGGLVGHGSPFHCCRILTRIKKISNIDRISLDPVNDFKIPFYQSPVVFIQVLKIF
ncbi:MAG: hypothetical protein AAGF85_19970, partial [Bacteroidota bacterium]